MEGVVDVVGATPFRAVRPTGPHHVVEHEQVGVAKTLGALGEVANQHGVVPDLLLGKDDPGAQSDCRLSLAVVARRAGGRQPTVDPWDSRGQGA